MVNHWISKIWTTSLITTHSPTRHATQPVTEDEVSQAARMADASDSASASHDSDCTPARRESRELPERPFLELECYSGQPWFDWFCNSHDNNFLEVPTRCSYFMPTRILIWNTHSVILQDQSAWVSFLLHVHVVLGFRPATSPVLWHGPLTLSHTVTWYWRNEAATATCCCSFHMAHHHTLSCLSVTLHHKSTTGFLYEV